MKTSQYHFHPNSSPKCRLDAVEKDEIDFPPNNYHVKCWELVLLTFSILSYIIDVFFDINLAYNFYKRGDTTYATLTLLFVLIPSLITIAVSLRWYFTDEAASNRPRSRLCWCLRLIVMILQLAPVLRYADSLRHAWKCRRAEQNGDTVNQRRYYKMMLKEDADAALLRVFECFLESAPQLVLQMTIIMIQTADYSITDVLGGFSVSQAPQALSILTSIGSISWSMAAYQRSIRFAQEHKMNMSLAGSMLQFTWHMLIAVSRILSFSVLASVYSLYTGLIALCHWLLMACWLMVWLPPGGCEGHFFLWKEAQCLVLGLVYLFVYIPTREGRTRNIYLLYYAIFFLENVGMLSAYGSHFPSDSSKPWYFEIVLVGASVSFFAGLITMFVYYGWFHPTSDVKFSDSTVHREQPSLPQSVPSAEYLNEVEPNLEITANGTSNR